MYKVCLLLGSNMSIVSDAGVLPPRRIIEEAARRLEAELSEDSSPTGLPADAVRTSPITETEPWGSFDGPVDKFFNQVFVCLTEKGPQEVLSVCQKIEDELGRKRSAAQPAGPDGERIYESRTIDIDVLLIYESGIESGRESRYEEGCKCGYEPDGSDGGERWREVRINSINLQVPHPKLHEREFAIRLLAEAGVKELDIK